MPATIVRFYSDTPVSTTGQVVKSWVDPSGCKWYRLLLGVNLSGKKLLKSFPANVVEVTLIKSTKP